MGDGFYRSKDPTNGIEVLKEKAAKENNTKKQLPQRAGSLGLNGGGTAAAVPPNTTSATYKRHIDTVSVYCDW